LFVFLVNVVCGFGGGLVVVWWGCGAVGGGGWGGVGWTSMQSACVILSSVACLYHILPHYIINCMTFEKKYSLAYSTEQCPSWEANRFSCSQELPRILWNPKVHYRLLSLSWASSIQSISPHFSKIHLNLLAQELLFFFNFSTPCI